MYMHSTTENKRKRWGKNYEDKRNWSEYNEQLVVRGEFYLDFSFMDDWYRELDKANESKRGGQFKYPESFIKWLTIWKQLVDYRGLEGIGRKIYQLGIIPAYPDYTTIWTRIHDLIPEISMPSLREAEVGTDGSGLKTGNAGEYRVFKYGDPDARMKKHLVVVITADVRTKKLLCVEVHIEGKGNTEASIAMQHLSTLKGKGIKISKFYGDGAFDQGPLFDKLHSLNIKPVVKIRKNASADYYRGSKYRRSIVREYKNKGYKQWANENEYGMRWPGTEGIFSAVKRKYGENTVSRSTDGLIAEGYQRFWVYDEIKRYGEQISSSQVKI